MLGTIALLGSSFGKDLINGIVDKTSAKHIFVIMFDKGFKYVGLTIEDKEDEERYLYKRAKEGKPGKFITGRISSIDLRDLKANLRKLKENLNDSDTRSKIDKFKKKKIAWIQKSSILKNNNAIAKIPQDSACLLKSIVEEIIEQQDRIMKDLSDKVLYGDYGDILLTIKVDSRYLRDIEGFPLLLQIASQGEELSISNTISKCIICNGSAVMDELKEPLPFFTIDKSNFIPDGNRENFAKVFSLCRSCYLDLQQGSKYIDDKLNFDIPNASGHTRLRFWLIPQLNDPILIQDYIKRSEKGLASFKAMRRLSEAMDAARDFDLSSDVNNSTDKFLTYAAMFYHYDKQKHMRLVGLVDGIYPSRINELSNQKFTVDKIAFKTGNPIRFYFGLIIDFLENNNEGWMKTMTYIMSSIFTKKRIDEIFIIKILLAHARDSLSIRKLVEWQQIILKATLILEYLHRVDTLPEINYNESNDILPHDKKAATAAKFLSSHPGILYTKNLRAICAIGIAAGVIIKIQQKSIGSDSFISRLNRLEMDYTRLYTFFPQMKIKLKHYKSDAEYDDLFSYLGNNEISNLDPKQQVQKELMNLIFAIGMAHGFTLITKDGKHND